MDKPICQGFVALELIKLHLYEPCFDKLQPYFEERQEHLYFRDTDSCVLSVNTKRLSKT